MSDERTVYDDLEISENQHFTSRGLSGTEYEIHTWFDDPYYVCESAVRRMEDALGLNFDSLDYRSGAEVIVVPDDEVE